MNYKMRLIMSFVVTLVLALVGYELGAGALQPQPFAVILGVGLLISILLVRQLAIFTLFIALFAVFVAGSNNSAALQGLAICGAGYIATSTFLLLWRDPVLRRKLFRTVTSQRYPHERETPGSKEH